GARQEREPLGVLEGGIEVVAVDHQVVPAVGRHVDRLLHNLDAAEVGSVELTQESVVVARDVDKANPAVRRAQQNLDDVVMGRRPVPFRTQPPPVDNIADQVDGLGLMVTQEVDQAIALAATVPEVHVRQEQRTISARPVGQPVVVYLKAESHGSTVTKSCLRFMTAGVSARPCTLTIPKRSRVARFKPAFAAY